MIGSKDYLFLSGQKFMNKALNPDEMIVFSAKVTKYNKRNTKQQRILVITNLHLINIKNNRVKRRILLSKIEGVTKSTIADCHEFVVHVPDEYDYRYISTQVKEIIEILNDYYFKLYLKCFPVYGLPQVTLKEYSTTKGDRKKRKWRIPDECYLVKPQAKDISGEFDTRGEVTNEEVKEVTPKEENPQSGVLTKKSASCLFSRTNYKVSIQDFEILRVIGKGTFGKVYLVEMKGGSLYAMKVIRKDVLIDSDQIRATRIEKEILKSVNHPFLVSMEYVFQTKDRIYFVMKFVRGGEMFTYLSKEKRFSEERVKFYAAQIALALGHLHQNNVIYRDVKPENLLIGADGYICLADYGLAKILVEDQNTLSFCGTPEYLAPEIIMGEGHNRMVDWWSLGILVYEMLVGIPPFYHQNMHTMYQYITTKNIIFPDPKKYDINISETAKDLINKLLCKNHTSRLGINNDVQEILVHPFFADLDIQALYGKQFEAPFKPPKLEDKYDVSNFAKMFTEEPIRNTTISQSKMDLIEKYQHKFDDFSKQYSRK